MAKKIPLLFIAVFISAFLVVACKKPTKTETAPAIQDGPAIPDRAPDYPKSSNDEAAFLGRVLFYDSQLSSDNTIRCASCHQQSKAFADDQPFSTGVLGQKTTRNSPSIFPKEGRMFWDGRASNLGEMVVMPITNHIEMNIKSLDDLCQKLAKTDYYPTLFKRAFGSTEINKSKLASALREFVFNFDFSKNAFKASNTGGTVVLKEDEKRGKDLFFGKAKCGECHHIDGKNVPTSNGYGVTDESHNIGLDMDPTDKGVGEISKNKAQEGEFMMPVLLNVELTAPYMHDGRFQTLEQVIEHYNSEVKSSANLDWRLKDFSDYPSLMNARMSLDRNGNGKIDESEAPGRPAQQLNLTVSEKAQLVKFLRTLTDQQILNDPKFGDPFVN